MQELNPENVGIIGAASVSGEDNIILVDRESGEAVEEPYGSGGIGKELSRKRVEKEYGGVEGVAISDSRMRAEAYKNMGLNSKIDIRAGVHGNKESHGEYNLKTEPPQKKERRLRKLIRTFMKPGSN